MSASMLSLTKNKTLKKYQKMRSKSTNTNAINKLNSIINLLTRGNNNMYKKMIMLRIISPALKNNNRYQPWDVMNCWSILERPQLV